MKHIKLKVLLICAAALLLSSCGGGKITGSIGGTVTGLSGGTSLVLQDNGGDNLTVRANGTFAFPTQIQAGSTYVVTILTPPIGETCVVENSYGTVQQSIGNVNSIVVVCNVTISAANDVTGQVNGLKSGNQVKLSNNGTDSYTVTGTGAAMMVFAFPTPLGLGAAYNVAVQTNPSGQTCTVTNGVGTITANGQVPTATITTAYPNGIVGPVLVACQ